MEIIYTIDPTPSGHIITENKIHFGSFFDMIFILPKDDDSNSYWRHTTYSEYFALEGFHMDYAVHLN